MKSKGLFLITSILVICIFCLSGLAEGTDIVQSFSDDNLLIQEDYVDENGQHYIGEKGFARHVLIYDDGNHVIREEFYNENLELAPNKDGVIIIEKRYDENGRVSWYRYLDASGQPLAIKGICEMEKGYDEAGNLNREIVLNGDGDRTLHADNWCEHTIQCNDLKQKISERWFDTHGNPVLYKNSYSGIDRAFDEAGNTIRETYYNLNGEIGPNSAGIITIRRGYDDQKRLLWYGYLDADENPMIVKGICYVEQGYDEAGNVNRETLYNGYGDRMLHPDGWSEHQIVFNDQKQKVSESWFGTEDECVLYKGSYSRVDRVFDEAGNIIRETYYDIHGNASPNAQGIITIVREYDENKRVIKYQYLDAAGQPMAVNGIYAMQQGYDEAGNLNSEIVLDENGNRALHPDGWCEHVTVYNELKQKISERWYDVDGNPALVKGSHSGVDRAFDEGSNAVRETYYDDAGEVGPNKAGIITVERQYDDQKRVIRYRYLDAANHPMAVNGIYGAEQGYDEGGNINLEILYDGEGKRTLHPDGWCEHHTTFDSLKRKIAERWYGIDGEPVLYRGDFSGIERVYDDNGNLVREVYYDSRGEVGPNKVGAVIIDRLYNEANQNIRVIYLDARERPILVGGVYQMGYEYDSAGNVNKETVFDQDGNRTTHPDGWCDHTVITNDLKQRTAERYDDVDGKPALFKGDFSGIDRHFNEDGKVDRETYYDASGEVGPNKDGKIVVETDYNENGLICELRYLDANGAPMMPESLGACIEQREYDENGNMNCVRWLDAKRKPMRAINEWATARYVYDGEKRKISEAYYDENDKLCQIPGGYAMVVREYDELGNVTLESYFDENEQPTYNAKGIAMIRREFDGGRLAVYEEYRDIAYNLRIDETAGCAIISRFLDSEGRVLRESYFDARGKAMINPKKCCASILYDYDDMGRVISQAYFDTDDAPLEVNGVHRLVKSYDASGNVELEQKFDVNDQMVSGNQGYAAVVKRYDGEKRVTEESYYNKDGQRVNCTSGYAMILYTYGDGKKPVMCRYYKADGTPGSNTGYHMVVYAYDENENVISESYYDDAGMRVLCTKGYAVVTYRYDWNGKVMETAYYDTEGHLIPIAAGYAKLVRRYDAYGNIAMETYCDENDEPVVFEDGYAGITKTYDQNNKVLTQTYVDTDGQPVLNKRLGYATVMYEYDLAGRKTKESYFDKQGNPITPKRPGCASKTWEYDEEGRVVNEFYWNAEGKLKAITSGYAGINHWYSDDRRTEILTYLDDSGKVLGAINRLGYSKIRKTYDEANRLIKEEYLNYKDEPTTNRTAVYGRVLEYDEFGRLIREYTFGSNGQPNSGKRMYSITEYSYDEAGNRTVAHYSSSGKRVN